MNKMKTQTIGVEIEMTGLTREMAAEAVAKYFGTAAENTNDAYKSYVVKDNTGRIWRFMSDGSIHAQRIHDGKKVDADGKYRVEMATPILNYGDIETLQDVVRAVRNAGAFVNRSCGLHVHIGAKDFNARQLRNLLNYVASREEIFYAALNVYENRKEYCGRADKRIVREVNKNKPATLEQFKEIWYNKYTNRACDHYDESRYTVLNLHSFFSRGTIEFRIFNSTLQADEVTAYVQFCLALTHFGKTTKRAMYSPKLDRFADRMKMILDYIGLTGEEFKNCRQQLLKYLKGGKAAASA